MTISKDLFLAILSMDSYNRGYGEGISGLGGKGTKIGSATLGDDSSILKDENDDRVDQSAGFYAIAYDVSGSGDAGLDGKVISYRGLAA